MAKAIVSIEVVKRGFNSTYTLKVEPTKLADRLQHSERRRGVKDGYQVFSLKNWKNDSNDITNMSKTFLVVSFKPVLSFLNFS